MKEAGRARIWIALIVAVCLIGKVLVIRRVLGLEVNVLDLVIPPILLTAYELVLEMRRKGRLGSQSFWWRTPFWAVVVVLTTLLSLLPYLP